MVIEVKEQDKNAVCIIIIIITAALVLWLLGLLPQAIAFLMSLDVLILPALIGYAIIDHYRKKRPADPKP